MRRTLTIFGFLLILSTGSALAQTFGAVLTGSQEVPPTNTAGFGNATVRFTDATHIEVTINVANLGSAINNFHIHENSAGANGPVVVNLIGLGGAFVNGKMTGTFPIDPAVAARLIAHPETFYVNVHTTQFPGGAVRGQLAPVSGTLIAYAADLRGSNEVPPNTSNAFGSAYVTIDTTTKLMTFEVTTSGIVSPTLAHIHGPNGPPGVNQGVIINFATAASQIPNGRAKGTIDLTTLSQANYDALINTPQNLYVNVHSSAFPGGEVRGQLTTAKEVDIPVAGAVGTFLTDVRIFNPSFDTTLNGLIEYFPQGTTANVNATHTMVFNIPPRGTGVANNIAAANLLNSGIGIGALRLTSANNFVATSKIYSTSGGGTFGQFLPGIPRGAALRRGVVTQLTNNADFRTNVGFFNPNQAAVTVRLDLRDENSNVVATSVHTFQALAFQQNSIGTYFPGVDLTNKANLTLSFDAGAPIDVYGAVNDNRTTDSFVVVAQEDPGVAANSN
jgi:CHRD domain